MCNFNFSLLESYYSLSIKHQVFVGILGIILINLIAITGLICLILYLLSISSYKDIINLLDNKEFNQIALLGIATEHSYCYYSDFFKIYSNELTNFRYYLGKIGNLGLIDPDFLKNKYPNFLIHSDMQNLNNKPGAINETPSMTYFSKDFTIDQLNNDQEFLEQLKILNSMVLMIRQSQKFYLFPDTLNNNDSNFPYYEKIVMVDYEKAVVFTYPDYGLVTNAHMDPDSLLNYVQTQYASTNKFINYINNKVPQTNFQINMNFNNTIRYLPLFIEKDIYNNIFSPQTTLHTMSVSNFYNNRLLISDDNYLDNIDSNVLVLSTNSIADLVYDNLASKIGSFNIFNTDYHYPYDLYTIYQCQSFYYTGNDYNISIIKNFTTLSECFNGKSSTGLSEISKNIMNSDYEKLAYVYGLFMETEQFPISNSTKHIMNSIDDNNLIDYLNLISTGSILRLGFYDDIYKTRKSYFPLTSQSIFNYFYPVTNIQLSFIFKNEAGFEIAKYDFFLQSIANFLMSYVGFLIIGYFILGLVVYFLQKVMKYIDTPLNIIDDALKTISDQDKFNQAKVDLENYIYNQDYNTVIDEFVDLITIILHMIEGNMNLKRELTHNEMLKIKMRKEDAHKEIAMVKLNNLIVIENAIAEKLENQNFFNETLKISLDNEIMQDKYVKSCECFVELVNSHVNKAKRSKLEKLKITNLVYFEEFEAFAIPPFKFNKYCDKEKKFVKNSTLPEGNSPNNKQNNIFKDSRTKTFKKITSVESIKKLSSSSSDEEIVNKDDRFDPGYQKKMIKKMMNIKDSYFLGKLKDKKNPMFSAYSKMKNELNSKPTVNTIKI